MPEPTHLTLPLHVTPQGRLSAAPIDSPDELRSAVLAVLRMPVGHLPYFPEFGTDDLAFGKVSQSVIEQIRAAVRAVEPRIDLAGDEVVEQAIRLAAVEVSAHG